jgi:hypothetical protein
MFLSKRASFSARAENNEKQWYVPAFFFLYNYLQLSSTKQYIIRDVLLHDQRNFGKFQKGVEAHWKKWKSTIRANTAGKLSPSKTSADLS